MKRVEHFSLINILPYILRNVPSLCETLRMRSSRRLSFPTYVCFCTKATSTWASGTVYHILTIPLALWASSMMVGVSMCPCETEFVKRVFHKHLFVWFLGNLPIIISIAGCCQTTAAIVFRPLPKLWPTEAWNKYDGSSRAVNFNELLNLKPLQYLLLY